jgi:hypothetical protein
MDSIDEFKSVRYKAFELENRAPGSIYRPQILRYEVASAAFKADPNSKTRSELATAFVELRRAFVAWQEEV